MDQPLAGLYVVLAYLAFGKMTLGLLLTILINKESMAVHRVFNVAIPQGQRLRELFSSLHMVTDAIALYALIQLGWIRLATNSLSNVVITYVVFYVWVEVWYYTIHRWAHANKHL